MWKWFLALFRLSLSAVCEKSQGMGLADYHDYPDSTTPQPWHFFVHKCSRCQKEFTV